MTKSTLYFDDSIHQAHRLKAAETKQSMSELVNDALQASLQEDLEDTLGFFLNKLETHKFHKFSLRKGDYLKKTIDMLSIPGIIVFSSKNLEKIDLGVLQGSILGVLFFLIYVNNFQQCSSELLSFLFAAAP